MIYEIFVLYFYVILVMFKWKAFILAIFFCSGHGLAQMIGMSLNGQRRDVVVKPDALNLVSTEIICHRNFGNEFAFTHSKDLYLYTALLKASLTFDNETSPQN